MTTPTSDCWLEELVSSIEEQRALGQYKRRHELRERLREVLGCGMPSLAWLTQPWIEAIRHNDGCVSSLRTRPNEEESPARPLLFWLCQWRHLRDKYGWQGRDDMVLLALRLGARVECESETLGPDLAESVLSAAIAYGTADTIRHLIQYHHHGSATKDQATREWIYREMVLQDIFRKALDRSCPNILQVLLRFIPATERVWRKQNEHVTAVDYLLSRLVEVPDNNTPQVSAEDLGQCILQLLQQGVTHTPLTLSLLSQVLYGSNQTKTAQTIFQMFFGNWLPRTMQPKRTNNNKTPPNHKPPVCVICLEDPRPHQPSRLPLFLRHATNPTVTLYCGHTYCDACIRQWGASQPETFRSSKTVELSCPICRKPLAREFLSHLNRVLLGTIGDRRRNTLGLDPTQHYPPGPRGPQNVSRDQILLECQARGVNTNSYDDAARTLAQQWNTVKRQRREGPDIMVDLGASKTLSPHYVAPKWGPALIPVWITMGGVGIPLLAGISGSSPYTVVTPAAAKLFPWKQRQLASNEFQQFQQEDDDDEDSSSSDEDDDSHEEKVRIKKTFTRMQVMDELIITLDKSSKMEVRLRNAVVSSDSSVSNGWRPGIVLGLDFLESAAWTQIAVEVDIAESIRKCQQTNLIANRRFMILLHGGLYIHRVTDLELATTMPEEFRYYAFNGKTFRCPLFHIHPPTEEKSKELFFSVGHNRCRDNATRNGRNKAAFTECEWCCRMFHYFGPHQHNVGMIRCKFCHGISSKTREYVFYCDRECQKLAEEAHAHRHDEYWGMMASWCRVVIHVVWNLLRTQGYIFAISFLVGFSASMIGKWWGQAPVEEMWAQHSLLLPRVE